MKHLKSSSLVSAPLTVLLGVIMLMVYSVASAHTTRICWEDNGAVTTFYAGSYHEATEGPSPIGGIIVDGFEFPFSGWISASALPASASCVGHIIDTGWGSNPPAVIHYQTFTSSFASDLHTVSFTATNQVQEPWGDFPQIEFGGGACTDADFDGICNDVDACPLDFSNDADGDGVCGDLDNCPNNANTGQTDANNNGQGDACEGDICGNSLVTGAEQCDDGNIAGGDGCSSACTVEQTDSPIGGPLTSHAAISGGPLNIAASCTVNADLAAQAAVTIGANTTAHNIYAGAAVTIGALSKVENIFSGAATSIGTGAKAEEIYARAATTVGADGVLGDIHAGAAITLGAGATAGSQDAATASAGGGESIHIGSEMDATMESIRNVQSKLGDLVPTVEPSMATTMGGYIGLEPGVHYGGAVTIAASSTVSFDGTHVHVNGDENQVWIMNLSEAVTVGAATHFETVNLDPNHTATIIWNIGSALNLGAGTSFRGTAFVNGAVNAATSSVSCGHLYATGAISVGSIGVDSYGVAVTCENSDAAFTYLGALID